MTPHDGDRPTLYAIKSCDTCRQARQWLDAHGIVYRLHDLRDDGLDIQMLERWADHLDWRALLNTRSLTWRKLPEVDRSNMSLSRALAMMLDQPTLVKPCWSMAAVSTSASRPPVTRSCSKRNKPFLSMLYRLFLGIDIK